MRRRAGWEATARQRALLTILSPTVIEAFRNGRTWRRLGRWFLGRWRLGFAICLGWTPAASTAEQPLSIERLSAEGWEIAGYTGTFDNRSSLILFRRKDTKYLVQCSILYDVTRSPRVITNCYELH
jgi:hypothetical protein